MSFLGDLAAIIGGVGAEENRPTSTQTAGWEVPTFNPGLFQQILGALPKTSVQDTYGYTAGYDPATGKMTMNRPAGVEGPGGSFSKQMQDYIASTGKRLYNETVLPSLERRGVLGRGPSMASRPESLYTRDWGTMMSEQGQKAGAQGIGMELQNQEQLMKQIGMALAPGQGALPMAKGRQFQQTTNMYS